jgi:hypothetical protein
MAPVFLILATTFARDQLIAPEPGVTRANLNRIHPGMSRKQVQAILGGPAQRWSVHNAGLDWSGWWISDQGIAGVAFDAYRTVEPGIVECFENSDEWVVDHTHFYPPEARPFLFPSGTTK